MKQDLIFPTKPFFTFTLLVALVLTLSHCKKRAIAYETNINGNDVVICPVNKVTDTIQINLSSLVESCKIVKLQNTTEGLIDRAWHTEISKD